MLSVEVCINDEKTFAKSLSCGARRTLQLGRTNSKIIPTCNSNIFSSYSQY